MSPEFHFHKYVIIKSHTAIKNVTTCSYTPQLLVRIVKTNYQSYNRQIISKNSPIDETKLHDEYNCTDTSQFSSALSSATVPPPLVH